MNHVCEQNICDSQIEFSSTKYYLETYKAFCTHISHNCWMVVCVPNNLCEIQKYKKWKCDWCSRLKRVKLFCRNLSWLKNKNKNITYDRNNEKNVPHYPFTMGWQGLLLWIMKYVQNRNDTCPPSSFSAFFVFILLFVN